jgi:cell division protein FtsB
LLITEYVQKSEGAVRASAELDKVRKENAALKQEVALLRKEGEKWKQMRKWLSE